jgi:predicted MFS family arabinose efflux permease
VPVERRSTALGVHTTGATVGAFVGLSVGGWLATVIGWRLTFVAMAVPGLLLALVIRLALREPPRGYADGVAATGTSPDLKEVLGYLWGCRSFVQLVAVFGIGSFTGFGLIQWLPSFYVREFGLSTAAVGFLFGTAYGIGSGIGTIAGGPLADVLMRRDLRWGCWIGIVTYTVSVPAYFGVFFAPTAGMATVVFLASSAIGSLANAPMFGMIQSVVEPRARALASAITMFSAAVIGIGGGPFAVGVLSDLLAPRFGQQSLRYALMVMALLSLWPVYHFWRAARTVRADIAAVKGRPGGAHA